MFPIIHLPSQLKALNRHIFKYQMTKEDVIVWLDCYGKLIRPDEEHFQRYLPPLLGISVQITIRVNAYIFHSYFGFLNVLKFTPLAQIVIRQSMDKFWDETGA